MRSVFSHCDNLQELDLSIWDMSSVDTSVYDSGSVYNYAGGMLSGCDSLHTLRLGNCSKNTISKIITSSSLPTGKITDSEGNIITRKIYCKQANTAGLTAPDGWKFIDVTPYKVGDFASNTEITEVEATVNNTCTDLSNMFYWCSNLTTVNTTEWDTSNVTTMANMFYRCIKLTSLDLDNFDTSNVTDMHGMFEACDLLDTLSIANFDTSKVTNMSYMFHNCHSLTTLDLSHFDTSNVTNMCKMFDSCDALTELHLGYYWDMSKVADTRSMFYNCKKLSVLNLQNCSKDTITKIITSEGFPTGMANETTRKIYCKQIDAPDESLIPSGWQLIPVD
jgi:surface protein